MIFTIELLPEFLKKLMDSRTIFNSRIKKKYYFKFLDLKIGYFLFLIALLVDQISLDFEDSAFQVLEY